MKLKLCWFIVISSLTILFCGLNACSKKQPNNGVNLEEVGIEFSDYYKQYDDLKSCRIYYAFDMEEDLEKIKGYWNDLYKDGIRQIQIKNSNAKLVPHFNRDSNNTL